MSYHVVSRNRHGNKVWLTPQGTWSHDYAQRERFDDKTLAYYTARKLGADVEKTPT